nr:flagellar biosynthesis protein FlhF [Halorhodospira neutriphila]
MRVSKSSSSSSAPPTRRSTREPEEEPEAMREMREELRTLRSLFENQLSVLEWERMGRRHPARATVLKRLADLGLGSDVSRHLAEHLQGDEEPDAALRKALALVARHLPVADDEIVSRGGVVALVGPTGVGKTTTVAKLAARYALHHGREQVALVSTDNYRVGAQDQLLTYARILDVPVYTATNRHELRSLVDDLMGRGLVLIDTVGMSQRDVRLAEQFKTLGSAQGLVRTYLVLSAATQLSTLTESVSAFAGAEPVGCIFTKVDEATTLGGALTCALRTRLPVSYLGVGQRVPEDLQAAKGENLVHRACALLDEEGSQEPDEEALALSLGGGAHVPE